MSKIRIVLKNKNGEETFKKDFPSSKFELSIENILEKQIWFSKDDTTEEQMKKFDELLNYRVLVIAINEKEENNG